MVNICYVDPNNSSGVFGLINSVSIVANDAYNDLLSLTEKNINLSLSYYNVSTLNLSTTLHNFHKIFIILVL